MADKTMDAIELIISDHRWVDSLFDALAAETAPEERRSLAQQIVMALSRHAAAEEQLLYPLARRRLGDGDPLVETALGEHQELKETLAAWDKVSADNVEFESLATQARTLVEEHVDEEETVLLPKLAAAATVEELADLGRALAAAEAMGPTRPHPHAPNRPPFNVPVGLASAALDKARDLMTGRGRTEGQD